MANLNKQEGGYSCRFVEKPKELQTECIICLCILRDPYIVSCCGLKFCRVCINAIETRLGTCPHCQSVNFSTMSDKQLKRQLDERQVYCSNEAKGCKWKGELRHLLAHLDSSNSTSCQYQHVPCPRCRDKVQRKDLDNHVKLTCPHRDVACVYEYAGCRVKVRQTSLEIHLQKNTVEHAKLSGEYSKRLSNDLTRVRKSIADLTTEVRGLRQELLTKIDKNTKSVEKSQNVHKELKKTVDFNKYSTRQVRYLLLAVLAGMLLIALFSKIPTDGKVAVGAVLGAICIWIWLPNFYTYK